MGTNNGVAITRCTVKAAKLIEKAHDRFCSSYGQPRFLQFSDENAVGTVVIRYSLNEETDFDFAFAFVQGVENAFGGLPRVCRIQLNHVRATKRPSATDLP